MRNEVIELAKLGPLPGSDAEESIVARYEKLLSALSPPVSHDEARELVKLFGNDDCFGLAWTLLHLIETTPGGVDSVLADAPKNEWTDLMKARVARK